MAKVMMVYTLLLLAMYIAATTTNSSRRTYRTSRHHRQWVTTNFSIRRHPTSRHHGEWATTSSTTRPRTASKQHRLWSMGLVSYPGIHDKHKTYSSSIQRQWEGSSTTVKDCPSGCYCTFRQYSLIGHWYQGLLVKDCTSDPTGELPKLFNSHRDIPILELNSCLLSRLPQDILKLHLLRALYLIKNEFTEVPSQLQQLPVLQALFIEDNKAEYIRIENITKLSSLTWLSLSQNRIAALPDGIGNMRSLLCLNVSGNQIQSLPEEIGALTQLENLDLSYNKISALNFQQICSHDFHGSFQFMNLSNNRITTIETIGSDMIRCFSTGAVIDLANNRLSTLDSWPLLLAERKSMNFDVSGNILSEFTNSAGTFLPTFKFGTKFYLQQNQIRNFMDIFNGWKIVVNTTENLNILLKNTYFDLAGNPLVCDCVDYEVYRYIQTLRTEQYNNLVCQEPQSLSGKNPHHIPLGNFVCQLDVNCPNGCTCFKVPHSQSINVTCGSYNQTDIPEIVPDLPDERYGYRIDILNQGLHKVSFRPYLQKATGIILSNNYISAIKINSSKAFQLVKILHLDNNRLQRLPKSVAGVSNESAVELRLGSNPWICDCKAIAMKNWIMLNLYIVKDSDIIHCHSPPNMVGVKVKDIERSMVCPNENKTAVYVVVAISIVVVISILYLVVADRLKYAKWRLLGRDECEGEHKEFDIFMCASSADSEYVENFLIPELERRDFRVLYHVEHFDPRKPIHVNMSEAIEKSKRILVFFSNKFKASSYSMFEFHSAHELDIQNKTRRLITIKDTGLDMRKLDRPEVHYFQKEPYVRREDVKFWKLLEFMLPRNRLGAQVRY